jgi:hypothetical protein
MKTALMVAAVVLLVSLAVLAVTRPAAAEKKESEPQIGHMVFFTLKDGTPENRKKLVEACKKYLAGHDGTVYFSPGAISDHFKREVNDRDWDVALHLVFKDKAAHDKYQEHERHVKFVEEYRDGWKKVRVFDSEVQP